MVRQRFVAPQSVSPSRLLITLIACVLSACAGTNFDRSDAVISLQTTGVTEAQATCMADSLLALDLLHAADPRVPRTPIEQEALVSAGARCVSLQTPSVGPSAPTAEVQGATDTIANAGQSDRDILLGTPLDTPDDDQLRAQAIERLSIFGLSNEKAACVVDRLLAADAAYLLEDPDFGRGLDAVEASAFASCL